MTTKPDKPRAGQAPDEVEISLYEASKKIYARSVKGLFNSWRWALVWITQIVFYGLPWLVWNNRQAVLFDLETRRFYLFGLVLYPQDFIYLTGLLVIAALALFLFTAVAGRLWCGFACPQTVYTEIYMWIEKQVEGERSARMRLDDGPLSAAKVGRKALKHLIWVLFGLWTGFTFVGYFTPITLLASEVASWTLGPWETFWILFYGFATYGNAGWMREQVCKYMCPYARFQSAMFDRDTMIVTYDEARGEPRGARKKSADPAALNLGSCIDCTLCVQVCPTGIDIRNGLQYECIGCGACVDACDDVMDKMNYPRGLIRFATENGMANKWSNQQMVQRALRPRVLIYTGVLVAICIAVAVSLYLRTPLKVDVIRDRGAIARMVEQGRIENVFRLQAMNATEVVQTLEVSVQGLPGLEIASERQVVVQPTEVRSLVLRVQIPPGSATSGSHPIKFQIRSLNDSGIDIKEDSVFLVPR